GAAVRRAGAEALVEPALVDELLALPAAAVQHELAELGQVLGVDPEAGHGVRVAGAVARPAEVGDAEPGEEVVPQESVHLLAHGLLDDAGEEVHGLVVVEEPRSGL